MEDSHLMWYIITLVVVFVVVPLFNCHSCILLTLFVELSATNIIVIFFVDRTQPELFCKDILHVTINTTGGVTVDLNDSVSTGATFYPNQFITLNPSTLDGPRQVKATLQSKWGTSDTCTFLIYTKGKDVTQYCWETKQFKRVVCALSIMSLVFVMTIFYKYVHEWTYV